MNLQGLVLRLFAGVSAVFCTFSRYLFVFFEGALFGRLSHKSYSCSELRFFPFEGDSTGVC